MKIHKQTDYKQVIIYALFAFALACLQYVGDNAEPLGLALVFAMNTAGLSPLVSALSYFGVSLLYAREWSIVLCVGQAALTCFGGYIGRRLKGNGARNAWLFPSLCLSLSLGGYVAFAPFTAYALPAFLEISIDEFVQKAMIAALIFLMAAVFSVAVKALLKKCLKCRLHGDEIVFCSFFFVLVGVGICKFLGVNAYMGIALFVLLTFSCATKDASALFCAFILSLPPLLVVALSPERFFIYGIAITLFVKQGRLPATLAALGVFFAYGYLDGLYFYETQFLVPAILSAVLPALLYILIPVPLMKKLENKVVFYREKHLSRIAINRNRAAIGEQLFEIAAVFREIQTAFSTLGTTEAEQGAREYIRGLVVSEVCKSCAQYRACQKKGAHEDVGRLVEVGCGKGRANLMDIPTRLADACINQSGILYAVNRQLNDYQKYMTETENAANGRALLAGQAQGVSEILKNLAVEQSEPLKMYTEKERALSVALLNAGIVCSEVLIYGEEDNPTLSLITFGKSDVKKIAAVASAQFAAPMMISQRISLSREKYCCILRKKPIYDAAFGVACMKKSGEKASGDTHSVIKIDERKFMVALSDGMGSGEYARKVSETTITLLESFYRAKMPQSTVLNAVNRLLAFSKEETFACVDIAVVDLDECRADIVKIGSPVGFILSGNTVKVLDSASLPLGILDCLHPETSSYQLSENDVLLFLSDGITGAYGSTTDLYDALKNVPISNPQELVDTLLQSALTAYGGVAKDDMTAVAVRLFKSAA